MKRKRYRDDALILHPSAFTLTNWPDSGLTRNTRAPGYRCSVPGLAGFTGTTLCGARSLITCQNNLQFPIANCRLVLPLLELQSIAQRERDDFDLISP